MIYGGRSVAHSIGRGSPDWPGAPTARNNGASGWRPAAGGGRPFVWAGPRSSAVGGRSSIVDHHHHRDSSRLALAQHGPSSSGRFRASPSQTRPASPRPGPLECGRKWARADGLRLPRPAPAPLSQPFMQMTPRTGLDIDRAARAARRAGQVAASLVSLPLRPLRPFRRRPAPNELVAGSKWTLARKCAARVAAPFVAPSGQLKLKSSLSLNLNLNWSPKLRWTLRKSARAASYWAAGLGSSWPRAVWRHLAAAAAAAAEWWSFAFLSRAKLTNNTAPASAYFVTPSQ